MKKYLIIIFLFLFTISYSQRIYRTEYKDSAQYCIYESVFKSDSTYSIYVVKDTIEFIGQGNWYFVTDKNQADFILYFTDYKSEAQFRVYYVSNRFQINEKETVIIKKKFFKRFFKL
jgi:hypothetical protein